MAEILIVAGQNRKAALELIGAARGIAETLGARVTAAVCGAAQDLPVQTIYHAESPLLNAYQPDLYLAALTAVVKQAAPDLILLAHDAQGQELGPRLAARLGAGCVTDCIGFEVKDGKVLARKPVFGGKAVAGYLPGSATLVATVRPRTQAPAADEPGVGTEVMPVALTLSESMGLTRVVDQIREVAAGPKLEEARIVISGGRGLGGPEPFAELQRFAELVGGAVGASRAACDAGWVPSSWQVGQTGKMVAPDLYIAIGISGASQHLAGISSAKNVIAINKDAEAPIFKRATLGVVADYKTVLPTLIDQCRQILGR